MTVLEQYKQSITELTSQLDDVSSVDCNNNVLRLVVESSAKLKEMMHIVEDVGIANGVMASALQIMMKDNT